MKRNIILVKLCLLLATLFPAVASAYDFMVDGLCYNRNSDGTSVTVTYQNSSSPRYSSLRGALEIPPSVTYSGTTYSVTSIGDDAFRDCSGLTSVAIPNSVTSIGYSAFQNCSGLTSVTIPNSVTSIGWSAFYGCSGLTSITIPDSVTYISSYAFKNCSGLTSVTIPNSVTSIDDEAFRDCSGLTSVTIPNSVTKIYREAFRGCSGLTSVTIGNSVTLIDDYAFSDCSGLTSVTIPNSVTSIGASAFSNCSGLTSVTWNARSCNLASWTFTGSTNIKAFRFSNNVEKIPASICYGLKGLTSVTIGNSVTSIGDNAFDCCDGLTSVTIPNSVTSIGKSAFSLCRGLTSITIPNSVTEIGDGAFSCSGLASIIVEQGNTSYDSRGGCNAIIETMTNNLIAGCKVTNIPNSVTSIGNWAFFDCGGLTSVTIPNSVTSIGDNAFDCCDGLTSVTIPNSVTSIGKSAFSFCTALTSVTIGNSVTSIGEEAFVCCDGLTSVTIGNSVTSIGIGAFRSCSSLTSVTIPNSVTSIGDGAFKNCTSLTSVTIPNSVTSIGEEAFGSCGNIETLSIDNNKYASISLFSYSRTKVKTLLLGNSVTSIGDYAFSSCSGLTSVTIGNSVTSIGFQAFFYCTGLTSVTIPNSVTSIGDYAFENCSGLTSVTIGNSVTYIGDYAFRGCSGLTSVTIPNSVTSIGYFAFVGTPWFNNQPDGLIYAGLVAYKYKGTMPSGTSIVIRDGTLMIGNRCFYGCSGLTSVTIPNSVTSIGDDAFSGCNNIRNMNLYGNGDFQANGSLGITATNYTLYIASGVTGIKGLRLSPGVIYSNSTAPPVCDANSFTAYTAALHVPESALVDYVTADYWSKFTDLYTDAVELRSLTLNQTAAVLNVGGNVTLTATTTPATFTPSGSVSWSSSNPAVATVNNNGNVTAVGFGECDISATLLDKTAKCHVTVREQQIVITLDKHELTMQPNKIEYLTPSISPVSSALVVESSDTGVVIARLANGKVQVISVKVGTATVTVSSADGKAVPDQCLVRVVSAAGIWDVNGDGVVDVGDVNTVLADILAGGTTLTYDVNGDGNIDVGDVNALLGYILDDEPKDTKQAVTKSQLITPMLFYRVGSSFNSGMMFWSFTDGKAAFGTIQQVGTDIARVSCSSMYTSWTIDNGNLVLGGDRKYEIYSHKIKGVTFVNIDGGDNLASNEPIEGMTYDAFFAEMKIDKALLWRALENAYESHLYYDIKIAE